MVRDYGSTSTDPTEHWIASLPDGRPFGWIQCFAAADYPDENEFQQWWTLGVDRTAAGIDYLVGDPRERGQGLGSAMIRDFAVDVVFERHAEWTQVCASPLVGNVGSWRALEKAGFEYAGTYEGLHGRCRLMVADRSIAER